mgnify:CR=1 FL=1
MNRKYLAAGLIAFFVVIGWNVFLSHRDDAMFKEYSRHQAMVNLKKSPSSQIR